jgi:hypothetical protein
LTISLLIEIVPFHSFIRIQKIDLKGVFMGYLPVFYRLFYAFLPVFLISSSLLATAVPPGFEKPGLIDHLLDMQIVPEEVVNTKIEMKVILRSYFKKITASTYIDFVKDHARYSELSTKIEKGYTLAKALPKNEFNYVLDIVYRIVGMKPKTYRPLLHQKIMPATDASGESMVVNTIKNYPADLAFGYLTTRLIPYEGGLLCEDTIHFKGKGNIPPIVKNLFGGTFRDIIKALRTILKAD